MSFDQIGFREGGALLNPDSSRYIRTTWQFIAGKSLWLESPAVGARHLTERIVETMVESVRKRNVFSRHSWENSFYLERLREFANKTVIEVLIPGTPDEITEEAQRAADVFECVLLSQTVLYMSRKEAHRRLALSRHRKEIVDFTIGPGFTYLRSSSLRERPLRGIEIDARLVRRFKRLQLEVLVQTALAQDGLAERMALTLRWLGESRFETHLPSAVVKTAIAFETLLGLNRTEPLRRSLSERAAFLLSEDPIERARIARAVKRFYDLRSKVVHGHSSSSVNQERLLEAADRICFLSALAVMRLSDQCNVFPDVAGWIDRQRWGQPGSLSRPFRNGDLARALERAGV